MSWGERVAISTFCHRHGNYISQIVLALGVVIAQGGDHF
jgi:hypothetical protein